MRRISLRLLQALAGAVILAACHGTETLPGTGAAATADSQAREAGSAPSAAAELSVVTLNIWHDQGDWPARLAFMVRVLADLEADVIGLQEVLQHERLPNQAETFARQLGYDYTFSSVDPEDRPRRYGNAILTPHPILARGWKALDPHDDYRTVAHVRIEVGGVELDVYNTHLHHTGEGGAIRRQQLDDLLAFIRSTRGGGPMILLGDFNAPVDAPEMRLLDVDFHDAYSALHTDAAALARTTLNPALGHTPRRIDHVFVQRSAFDILDARIILDEPDEAGVWASDHFGVVVQLRHPASRVQPDATR